MLTHVQIVHVPVSDQDRALDFYVRQLGMAVVTDLSMGPHGRWLQVVPEGAATSLALVPGTAAVPPGSVFGLVFETDDLDGDVAELRDRGVQLPSEIDDMPWGRAVQFTDPDGNHLVLQSPAVRHG